MDVMFGTFHYSSTGKPGNSGNNLKLENVSMLINEQTEEKFTYYNTIQ